jgi:xylulokinase
MSILAIDLGTSAIKFLRVDNDARVIALDRVPMSTLNLDAWMTAIAGINAISVTGQMHGLITRENGASWGPGIAWNDHRAAGMLPALRELIGENGPAITGGPLAAGFQLTSLAWIHEHDPERWQRITSAFLPKDALVHELTDRAVTDPSDAVGTGLFSPEQVDWAWKIVDALHIPHEWLPEIIPSGSIAGPLTGRAARTLGLAEGIPVIIAGGDAPVGAYGAGITREDDALVMLSSGAQIVLPAPTWAPDPQGRWYTWPSVAPAGSNGAPFLRVGTLLNAGNVLEWAGRSLYDDPLPSDPTNLIALPHLIGTRENPNTRGAIFGLIVDTTTGQIRRALIEGIAFSLRRKLDQMTSNGNHPAHIRIGGGLAHLPEVRQLFADVLAQPMEHVGQSDLSVWGAALLALGNRPTPATGEILQPDPARTRLYADMFRLYCDLDDTLTPIATQLATVLDDR